MDLDGFIKKAYLSYIVDLNFCNRVDLHIMSFCQAYRIVKKI